MSTRTLLAADIGGTKTAMVLARSGAGEPTVIARHVYASQDYPGLEAIIEDFLSRPAAGAPTVDAAGFAVAGPVSAESATLTNLGWRLHSGTLAGRFAIPRVAIINDFAAVGLGIAHLAPTELLTLQAGTPAGRGPRVVIGAGTGLGVGFLTWDGNRYVVHASEAGHSDFSPVGEAQDALLAHLRRSFERVSFERVVSGPGLNRIFSYLCDTGAGTPSKQLHDAMQQHGADPSGVIAEAALARRDPLAVRALDLFAAAYGSFAGNMALTMLASGGVYVAGGIAPKIAAKLTDGEFIRMFNSKGRFSALLSTMPVHVVMNPEVGLAGALDLAQRLTESPHTKTI
jgi:glucokinase